MRFLTAHKTVTPLEVSAPETFTTSEGETREFCRVLLAEPGSHFPLRATCSAAVAQSITPLIGCESVATLTITPRKGRDGLYLGTSVKAIESARVPAVA